MKEYKIICSRYPHEVSDRATALLNDGWELYGSPTTPSFTNDAECIEFAYCQAFVRNLKKPIDQPVNKI